MKTSRPLPVVLFLLVFLLALLPAGMARAVQVTKHTDSYNRDYFLFAPDKIDPARTYWLVVEIGGFQGATVGTRANDKSEVGAWVDRGDCIGISASFPQGYQILAEDTDKQLLDLFRKLQGDFNLHKKLFLYGHSGGAQYAHRFLLAHPRDVVGCCATSAGSWADDLASSARTVPLGISCGEKDTALTGPGAPYNRIDWAHRFEKQLAQEKFFYKAKYWPNAGHGGDAGGNWALTNEAFSLGTSGMVGKEYADLGEKLRTFNQAVADHDGAQAKSIQTDLVHLLNDAPNADQTQQDLTANGWSAGPDAIAACMQTRQNFAAEETKWLSDTNHLPAPPLAVATAPKIQQLAPAPAPAAAPPKPSVPVACMIKKAAPLESYGPDGLMTGVTKATVGQSYQCLRVQEGKAVLQDASGHIFKIAADAVDRTPGN